jgi:DNA-binding MarR family transcriptional regulator
MLEFHSVNDSAFMTGKPKAHAELDFLAAIERGEIVTQMTLRRRIGVSVGMVNALVKRAIGKGYAKVSQAPYKRYAYYLTPQGFTEKSRLVAEYLETSLDFFRTARAEYAEIFARVQHIGLKKIALVGRGELTEIAVLAALGEGVSIDAILDPEANEAERHGVRVIRDLSEAARIDAVVITESRSPQVTYEQMCAEFDAAKVFAPPLLRITPNRQELLARARQEEGT